MVGISKLGPKTMSLLTQQKSDYNKQMFYLINSNELEPLTHADSFLAQIGTFCSKIGHNTTCCLSFDISSKNLNKNST